MGEQRYKIPTLIASYEPHAYYNPVDKSANMEIVCILMYVYLFNEKMLNTFMVTVG